jgi:hypothetical protein
MHIKTKYINAIIDAIDFISTNVDGADEENSEQELLSTLHECKNKMREDQHKRRVNYYLNKK